MLRGRSKSHWGNSFSCLYYVHRNKIKKIRGFEFLFQNKKKASHFCVNNYFTRFEIQNYFYIYRNNKHTSHK